MLYLADAICLFTSSTVITRHASILIFLLDLQYPLYQVCHFCFVLSLFMTISFLFLLLPDTDKYFTSCISPSTFALLMHTIQQKIRTYWEVVHSNRHIPLFSLFQVSRWITFSEPEKFPALYPYLMSNNDYVFSVYKNVLLAHAYTYKLFKEDFKDSSKGKD